MTAKGDRRMVSARLSETGIENLEARAAREGIARSELIRRMLKYGLLKMPKGWQ